MSDDSAARARIAELLSAKRDAAAARKPVTPSPRYDEVFAEGVQWLDSLADDGVAAIVHRDLKTANISARNAAIESVLPLIWHLAHRRARFCVHLEAGDLVYPGTMGAIQAHERYRPELGPFPRYATWWIRNAQTRYADTYEHELSSASRAFQDMRLVKWQAAAEAPDAASKLQTSELRLERMRGLKRRPKSFDKPLRPDDDMTLHDVVPGECGDPETLFAAAELRALVRQAAAEVYSSLRPLGRAVLDKYMADDEASLKDVGAALGRSRQRASQVDAEVRRRVGKRLREMGVSR